MAKKREKKDENKKYVKRNWKYAWSSVTVILEVTIGNERGFKAGDVASDMYPLFTFETLHNLNLGISKIQKECVETFLSLETVMAEATNSGRERKTLLQVKRTFA